MRLAVVGGLAAGPAAAMEARRRGADVVLFEAGRHISVGVCEIPYYVAGRLGGASLEARTPADLEREGIDVRTRHRVTGLDAARGVLTVDALEFGSTHEERFDRVILATGTRPRRLGIDGETAAGVFSVRTLADADALRLWLDAEPVRHVVVVGGGYVGLELAETMRDRGLRATILDPQGRVLAGTLDPSLGGPMRDALHASGVAVRAERPTEIRTDGAGRVASVRTDAGEMIGCQCVVVAIGVEPEDALTRAAGLKRGASGALAVDDEMRTSARTVWACGDAVEVERASDGRRVHWPLAPVARRTARIAARNATRTGREGGRADRLAPIACAVAVRAFGVEAASVGLHIEQAERSGLDAVAVTIWSRSRTAHFPGSEPLAVRLVAERGSGRLLGGQLTGREGAALRANVLVPLIQARATADVLAEDTDLVYNPPVAPAVDPLRVVAREVWKAATDRSRR